MAQNRSARGRVHTAHPRRRLKKVLSLTGATIILATFIAKDARRDKLKELGDSLEVAQNTFDIEKAERETYFTVLTLNDRFNSFAASPSKPLEPLSDEDASPLFKGGGSSCHSLYAAAAALQSDFASVKSVIDLAERLHIRPHLNPYIVESEYQDVTNAVRDTFNSCNFPGHNGQSHKLPTKRELADAVQKAWGVGWDGSQLSEEVLRVATEKHEQAKASTEKWEKAYYALYALGWIVSVTGILAGDGEDKSVIEEMAEG